MTKKTQLPFIAFTLFSAAPGNVSLKPVTSEGVLLSQGTDEAVEIQRVGKPFARGPMAPKCWSQDWNTGLSELKAFAFY